MDKLCIEYNKIINEDKIDKLIIIPCFILDFLCIHPFNDGNGRISRLLTLDLLYRADYHVGKYISIERIIEETKETYYEALESSSFDWHENNNNYLPFIKYFLSVVLKAYREFEERFKIILTKKIKPAERILEIIKNSFLPLSKKEIMNYAPEISQKTVERALVELISSKQIEMVGQARSTKYKQSK